MATDKQIAANRLNALKSRGPVTPEGKARSARKPIRPGSLARVVLRDGESRAQFNEVVERLNLVLKPKNDIDHLLIGKMSAAHWRQLRLWQLEQSGDTGDPHLEMTFDRQFFRHFDHYLRLHPNLQLPDFEIPLAPVTSSKQTDAIPNQDPDLIPI